MKFLTLRYIVPVLILILQGTGDRALFAGSSFDMTIITAPDLRCHRSDEEGHLNFEIRNNSSRSENQAEKVETVNVVRTDSQQSRIKPVNLLFIIQSGAIQKESLSLTALKNLANPQTFHFRNSINILRL